MLLGLQGLQWGHSLSAMETTTTTSTRRPASSFNGAIAFQPWKQVEPVYGAVQHFWLQWGHSLSAMETSSVTMSQSDLAELQWGHSLSAMETPLVVVRGLRDELASMGP